MALEKSIAPTLALGVAVLFLQKQAGGMRTGTRPGGFEREDRERE